MEFKPSAVEQKEFAVWPEGFKLDGINNFDDLQQALINAENVSKFTNGGYKSIFEGGLSLGEIIRDFSKMVNYVKEGGIDYRKMIHKLPEPLKIKFLEIAKKEYPDRDLELTD